MQDWIERLVADRGNFVKWKGALGCIYLVFLVHCARTDTQYLTSDWEIASASGTEDDSILDFKKQVFPIRLEKEPQGQRITARYLLNDRMVQKLKTLGPLAFFSGTVSDVAIFYLNDTEIGRAGNPDPYRSGHNRHVLAPIPDSAWSSKGPDYLRVKLFASDEIPAFITDRRISMGPLNDVYGEYRREETTNLCLISLFIAVGMYHLLLAIRRPRERHNFYFGVFCIFVSAGFFLRSYTSAELFGDATLLRSRIRFISFYIMGTPLLLFLSTYFQNRYSKFAVGLGSLHLILVLATIFGNFKIIELCRTVWTATAIPAMCYMIFVTAREAYRGNTDARYIVLGFVFFMLTAAYDAVASKGFFNLPDFLISRYTFVLLILGIAGLLASRFVRLHNEVESLNNDLEKKVIRRTQQLQETLEQVELLKVQQDGDYFLTSILMRPLNGAFVQSDNVKVEILAKQKKQFTFRKWEAEIGGDLCVVHSVELRGKRYVVFLNGDAMGKSMQGAGGALVLGGVFKSIITRTLNSLPSVSRYPERWLRDCFLELQEVFVSFDGHMLVSAVLGMIDEETGLVYYINAEHPQMVLFRDSKAELLTNRSMLRKIGVSDLKIGIVIELFQARPGDVFLIGSDGRDDIEVGMDANGTRIINEDESLFLRKVEEGNGELKPIFESIQKTGSLIDDLTLIRIAFKEDSSGVVLQSEIENENKIKQAVSLIDSSDFEESERILQDVLRNNPDHPEALRRLARIYLKQKDFARAADVLMRASDLIPNETHLLYETSYALKFARKYDLAIDFGERVRLRIPNMNKNLINLADAYRISGNANRAKIILGEINEPVEETSGYRKLRELLSV
ncbi:MAG: SpoIIE family protein phosphatase [Spirochaetia bacterium]|nr:SpoIIE family protein phosphatase [Spirochaetia bacterium]